MAHVKAALLGLLGPALLVTACGSEGGGGGPGAVSEGEARALEEAAQMLEERRLPDGALPTTAIPSDGQGIEAASNETEPQETPSE